MKLRTKLIIVISAILLLTAVIIAPAIVRGRGDSIELAAIKGNTSRVRLLLRFSPSDAKFKGFHGYTPLHWAAMGGHTEIARMLIARGADVNALSKEKVSPLYLAAMEGHADVVKLLLKHGAKKSINTQCFYAGPNYPSKSLSSNSYHYFTPVYIATLCGHVDVMKALIQSGADVDLACYGGTPLIRAVYESNADAARLLLASGADVNKASDWGITPIGCVRSPAVARLLLAHGCRVDCRDSDQYTPLHNAEDPELVRLLLEHGADPNAADKYGNTPLHWCSNRETAELLLNHGARVNIKNKDGMTPTQLAIEDGRRDVADLFTKRTRCAGDIFSAVDTDDVAQVRVLLRSNPSLVNATPGGSHHPILTFAIERQNVDIVRVLLDSKADPLINHGCCRPVDAAARADNLEIFRMMRSRVRGSVSDREFLELATRYGNMNVAKLLIAEGVAIDQNGDRGAGLLGTAAAGGSVEMVQYLVSLGADVNGRDSDGDTPLMNYCCDMGNGLAIAKVLISHGADVTLRDKNGWTALERLFDLSPHSYELLALLVRSGAGPNKDKYLSGALKEAQDPRVIGLLIRYGAKVPEDATDHPGVLSRIREGIDNILRRLIP